MTKLFWTNFWTDMKDPPDIKQPSDMPGLPFEVVVIVTDPLFLEIDNLHFQMRPPEGSAFLEGSYAHRFLDLNKSGESLMSYGRAQERFAAFLEKHKSSHEIKNDLPFYREFVLAGESVGFDFKVIEEHFPFAVDLFDPRFLDTQAVAHAVRFCTQDKTPLYTEGAYFPPNNTPFFDTTRDQINNFKRLLKAWKKETAAPDFIFPWGDRV